MGKQIFLLLLGLLAAVDTGAKETPLFENGKSIWKIIIPARGGKTEAYAAEELQRAVWKISGARLPILRSDVPPESGALVIGSMKAPAIGKIAGELKLSERKDLGEVIAVRRRSGNLYLAGNNPRAALFAVYHFLQKELGVRWLWGGESGEFMPERTTYVIPGDLALHHRPVLTLRELNPCGLGRLEEHELFLVRNFNNAAARTPALQEKTSSIVLQRNHWVFPDPKLFQSKPEIFALYGGKRILHGEGGCWSNPEFQRLMIEKLAAIAKENRLDIMNAYPADSTLRCSCPACTANPDKSGRWFDLYRILVDGVKKKLPGLKFAGIAYQEYRPAPEKEVPFLEYVEYCQYDRCYVHRFGDPACKLNARSLEALRKWQTRAGMGIYGYEFDIYTGKSAAFVPFWNVLADEAKYFAKHNIRHIMTEAWIENPSARARKDLFQQKQRINYYIYSQMLWNPDASPDELLADFCRTVYGPAAQPMLDYFRAMADAWEKMPVHLTYFHNDSAGTARFLLNPALIKLAQAKFHAAQKTLAAMREDSARKRIETEIAIDRAHFESWKKAYDFAAGKAVSCAVPMGKSFDDALTLSFQTAKGEKRRTTARIYHTRDALHLLFDCPAEEKTLRRGFPGRDQDVFMEENIEIFLDTCDGESYRHFAFNPAGGFYDARGMDRNWNPEWKLNTRITPDGRSWSAEVTLPFASLGSVPETGSFWRLVLDRNTKPQSSGYPQPAYHDLGSGALLYFSNQPFPDRRLTWFVKDSEPMEAYLEPLYKNGWNYRIVRHREHPDADTSGSRLIVWSTHENRLDPAFFEKQILERVRNGATLICHQYGPCEYEKYFKDPSFKVGWSSGCDKLRRTTYIAPASFADYPDNLRKMLGYTPPLVLLPAMPEKWEVLARQKDSAGNEQPYILARPCGKGMVLVNAAMRNPAELIARFNNALEYNRKIRR